MRQRFEHWLLTNGSNFKWADVKEAEKDGWEVIQIDVFHGLAVLKRPYEPPPDQMTAVASAPIQASLPPMRSRHLKAVA